jgi:hypothetical protein
MTQPRLPTSRRHRGAATLLAFGLLAGLAAGCTTPRSALSSSSSSSCFKALAVAPGAVDHLGHFAGVRPLSAAQLKIAMAHEADPSTPLPNVIADNTTAVCVVVYRGQFNAGELSGPWPPGRTSGNFVGVVVAVPTERLLVTIVLRGPLMRFGGI